MATQKHVIVIGAGILGAAIAWNLARGGARVTVVATSAGGVATPNSFAWINASWGNPEPYFRLRIRAMAEWKRLAAALPGLPLRWQGGICWDLPDTELLAYAEQHSRWGYGIRSIDRAGIEALEPALRHAPEMAMHVAEEGAIEPTAAAMILLAAARDAGATIITDLEILGLIADGDAVTGVVTASGPLAGDHVVLAAGAGSAALAATAGIAIPMAAPPGLLVHSKPAAPLLSGLVMATELHLRQTADGRIVAGSDFGGTDPGENPEDAARALFAKVRDSLHGGDALEMDFHTVGYRPTPSDGFPIVGAVEGRPGLSLAVTHSGITLAPAIALFLSSEILVGNCAPLLAPYRLARFG